MLIYVVEKNSCPCCWRPNSNGSIVCCWLY